MSTGVASDVRGNNPSKKVAGYDPRYPRHLQIKRVDDTLVNREDEGPMTHVQRLSPSADPPIREELGDILNDFPGTKHQHDLESTYIASLGNMMYGDPTFFEDVAGYENDEMEHSLAESYARGVLEAVPMGPKSNALTQTRGTVYPVKGVQRRRKVTAEEATIEPAKGGKNLRRAAAKNDLKEIANRRKAATRPLTLEQAYIQEATLPNARALARYLEAQRTGGPGAEEMDAATAYSLDQLRLSGTENNEFLRRARLEFNPREFASALFLGGALLDMKVAGMTHHLPEAYTVGTQTSAMRTKSISTGRPKKAPVTRKTRSAETAAPRRSWADTSYGSASSGGTFASAYSNEPEGL